MSSWYVFNAMGFYPFSPADPKYIVSIPLFNKVKVQLDNGKIYTVSKKNSGKKITSLYYGGKKIDGYFITDKDLKKGQQLIITTH
jgi:putative alpha-1,2-mannosidase